MIQCRECNSQDIKVYVGENQITYECLECGSNVTVNGKVTYIK